MSPRVKAACAEARSACGKVALAAIGHGELRIGVRRLRLARQRGAQQRHGLLGILGVVGGDQRLAEHDLDQRRVVRERDGAAQRRDRFGRLAAFQQRLALELVEIRIVRLRLDQAVDLRDGAAQIAVTDRPRWRAHSAPAGCGRSSG